MFTEIASPRGLAIFLIGDLAKDYIRREKEYTSGIVSQEAKDAAEGDYKTGAEPQMLKGNLGAITEEQKTAAEVWDTLYRRRCRSKASCRTAAGEN